MAKKLGLDFTGKHIVKELTEYFVGRVSNITNQHGLDLAAWEDGLMGIEEEPYLRNKLFNKNIYSNAWDNVWELGEANRGYKLANAGYKVS